MFCEHCGTKLEKDAQFCQNCGRKTAGISEVQETSSKTQDSMSFGTADFYSEDWRRKKVWAVASLPYMDVMVDKDNLYAIKLPSYSGAAWGFFIGLVIANIIGMAIGAAIGGSNDTKKRKWYRSAWIVDGKLTSNHWTNDVFLKVPLRELKGKIEFGKNKFTLTQGDQKLVLQKSQKEVERLRQSIEKYVL